ncbi:uncharacterized protein LACBIDRAFT_331399 [Laccaria bicolor S238N-H82]|uniref:Predicted protein n=1 Tax=Laccaria bicolor (strain S238N-H82 / ATCC MYA-4686) TaxID=486041 RepID=B0DPD2_LACBS|nr:uncharacterized protein LACBIDRAFT_331399 [Laccaria bicolor S238N-H82]EDR03596.1 predicted protein [Laccaria bicolor S238N-H82]|eukprot:XP_001885744.1 predicted protein [Laccaria bicolor S238N-H82]
MATPSKPTVYIIDSSEKLKTIGHSTRVASKNNPPAEESAKGASTSAVPPAKGKATAEESAKGASTSAVPPVKGKATTMSPTAEESTKGVNTPAVPPAKGKATATLQSKPAKPGASLQKAPAPLPLPPFGSSMLQGSIEPIVINPPGLNLTMLQETRQIILEAPSLTYLTTISSISSLGNRSSGRSVIPQHIFEGILTYEKVMIYDESLLASLAHYHPCFNPAVDDDPLVFFRGINGKLPGKSIADSQGIHDLLWHWSAPHTQALWVDLLTAVDKLPQVHLTPEYISKYLVDSVKYYLVPPMFLEDVAQLYLAMYQILGAFQTFLEEVLQHCCEVCNSHIKEYFNAMRKIFLQTDEQESISTMYSTCPSIHSQFGQETAHKEVGKLLLCPDYDYIPVAYQDGVSHLTEAAVAAANRMHQKVLTVFYKTTWAWVYQTAPTGAVIAACSASNASYKSNRVFSQYTSSAIPTPQYAPSAVPTTTTQSIKVSMPASISDIAHCHHAISTMPGMGRIELPVNDAPATAPVVDMGIEQQTLPVMPPHLFDRAPEHLPAPASSVPSHWTSYQFKDNCLIPSPSDEDLRSPGNPPPGGNPPDNDSGGNGPGSGGGGPNGGPPGGPPSDPPGGPPGGGGNPPPGWCQLGMDMAPPAIEYISSMSFLARMSNKMKEGVAAMAPYKWSGCTKSWWECLPLANQTYFRQDWEHMMIGLCIQFLDLRWSCERLYEFEAMFFHQKGHMTEDPIDFIQHRVSPHVPSS